MNKTQKHIRTHIRWEAHTNNNNDYQHYEHKCGDTTTVMSATTHCYRATDTTYYNSGPFLQLTSITKEYPNSNRFQAPKLRQAVQRRRLAVRHCLARPAARTQDLCQRFRVLLENRSEQ